MRPVLLLLFSSACATTPSPEPTSGTAVAVVAEPVIPYAERQAALEARRIELAARARAGEDVRAEARAVLLRALRQELLPAWFGTSWDFHGTTTEPGKGRIACGYFVSTVLEDAGFRVERVALAQQPAEHIIKTLVPPRSIRRFRNRPVREVVDHVASQGEGLWIVGLDYHVGFLYSDGDHVEMCHSSYLDSAAVVCEPAAASGAMVSDYRVVGRLFEDPMIDAWLEGRALPTLRWKG